MRILYSHYLPSDDHVAARMVHHIAEELRLLGHQVWVHRSLNMVPAPAPSGTHQPSVGWKQSLRNRIWFARSMCRNRQMKRRDREILLSLRPDIVLCRQDAYCYSMVQVCQEHEIPVVTYADAPVAYESRLFHSQRWHPPGLVEAVERWVLRNSRAVITVSKAASRILARYDLDVPVHPVPNGIDPRRYSTPPYILDRLRQQLGLQGECVIGFQGSFRPFHGLDLLRNLMLALADRPGIRWLLVGDGPGRKSLEEAVSGRVPAVFVGQQPETKVSEFLQLMDIALVPHAPIRGDLYFCPLKVLECAAAGAAVVASDQGDIPWLLGDGGVIVPSGDEPAWVRAVEGLLEDPGRRQLLGQRARTRMHEQFTWAHTARSVESVLEQCLSRPKE